MAQSMNNGPVKGGNSVKVNVARAAVKEVRVIDTDIVLVLDDGRKLFIRDGAVQTMVDNEFAVEFSDGTLVSGQELLQSAGRAEITPVAVSGPQDDGSAAPVIAQLPQSSQPGAAAQPASGGGGLKTWLAIGTPLVGGIAGGVLGGGGGGSSTGSQTNLNVKPATPVINVISDNDQVNAADKARGIEIKGSSEANASVTVIWGTVTKTATADASGIWSVTYATSEVPADALGTTVSATIKSSAGVSSDPASRTVQIDTKLPDAPVIANVAGDNVVGPNEKINGVEVSGTAEANSSVEVTWGTVTKIAQADRVGSWKAQFLAGEVPPTGSSNVSAKATDAFGNVSNAASTSVVISPAVTITGQISAGPLQAGHGLTVDLYLGNGTLLASGIRPGSDGVFTASGLPVGVGDVVIARVNDTTAGGDYLDEATSALKDLNAALMAAKAIGSVNETLNITPITTIAAIKAGLASDGSGTIANAAAATNANAATASAFGLGGIDITTTRAITTESASYNPTNGLDNGEKIGAILAALSGADKANGGDAQATINALSQLVSASGATGTLLPQGQVTLMQGAAEAENAVPGSLQSAISDAVAAATPSPRVAINTVASDNIITATELSGLVVSGTVTSGASAVSVAFGSRTVAAVLSGTSWTYTATAADIAALGADGAKLLQATATFADNSTAGASRLVSLKATPPALPVFTRIAADTENFAVNASEKRAGFAINGTGEPGTTVSVTLGSVTKSREVATNGTWSVTFEGLEIPASDGNYEVAARAKDVFGNETAPVTRNLLLDTQAPTLLTFNQVTGDNRIGPNDTTAVRFEGTAEAGATVNVLFDGNTYTGTATSTGSWSISLPASRIPADSTYEAVATVVDAAGNAGVTARQNVVVDVSPPAKPTIDVIAGDDNVNKAERDNPQGIVISGKAEARTLIEMSWGGKSYEPIRASSSGTWSFTLTAAKSEIPVDGSYPISVVAVDASGNRSEIATRPGPVIVDTVTLPVVITKVSGDDRINLADRNGSFTVEGEAEKSSFVTVKIDGMTETTSAGVLDGKWSVTFTPTSPTKNYLSGFPLDATNVVVTAQSSDVAGNASQQTTRVVAVDTQPPAQPTIALVAGDDAINAVEGGSSVTIRGRAEADSKVTINWGTRVVNEVRDVDSNGDWSIIVSRENIPDEGSADIIVRATDAAGNVSIASEPRRILIDKSTSVATINPVGGTDNIINNAERNNVDGVAITGRAEANGRVEVTIGTQTVRADVNDQGDWRAVFLTGQLPGDGAQTVFVRSFDKVGNEAPTVAQRQFTVDLTSTTPEFTGTITPAGAIRPADDIVNVAERNGGVTVRGRGEVGGTAFVTIGAVTLEAPVLGDGSWAILFEKEQLPETFSGNVSVNVRDAAGNISATISKPLTIDTTPPAQPTISTVAGNNIVNKTERDDPAGVDVSGRSEAGARVFVRWGPGGVLKETNADSNGDWTVNFLGTEMNASGATQIIAYQADAAGNIGPEQTRDIIVDAGTPALPSIGLTILGGDNTVNSTEYGASSGMVISGTAVAGNKVRLSWGSVTNLETDVLSDGTWSYTIFGSAVTSLFDTTTTIRVRQIDPSGNEGPDATRTITIDRTAPIGAAITSQSGTDQANDRTLNAAERDNGLLLSGTAASDARLVRISYTANGLPKSFDAAVVNGAWTYSIGKDDLPADTANGVVFSVSPIDLAGNVGNATPFTYNFDLTPPSEPSAITFGGSDNVISILEADVNSPSTPIVVGGALSANHGASKVVVTWAFGGNTYSQEVAVLASATSWSLNWNKANLPSTDGSYVVNAYTVDAAGNASALVSRNLTIDRAIPATLSFTSITANGDNIINAAEADAATLNVSGVGGTAGATVFLTLGTSLAVVGSATVAPGGSWTINLAKANYPTVDTNFNVYQVLPNSNRSPIVSQPVTLDLSPPQNPTITAPAGTSFANDAFINASERPGGLLLQGTAPGASQVLLSWRVGTTDYQQTVSVSGGLWDFTIAAARLPTGNPVTTTNFTVRAFDAAGNPSANTAQQSYTFDGTPPSPATNVSFAGDNIVNASEAGQPTLNFTGDLAANHGARRIVIVWNGRTETFDLANETSAVAGWVVPWSNAFLPSTASSTAQIFTEDAAGNRTLVERIITNDRSLPDPLTNIVVAQDNKINAAEADATNITITGGGASTAAGTRVFVTLGGVTREASSIASDGTWSAIIPTADLNLNLSSFAVSAYQRNLVGNESQATQGTVEVDRAFPAVLTIDPVAGDNRINLAESSGVILLQGTTDAGTTVSVTWGTTTKPANFTSATTWQVSFSANERPPLTDSIPTSFTVTSTDGAGNTKPLPVELMVDLSRPTNLTANLSGGDDRVNITEAAGGVTISGQAEVNAPITVNWGGRIQTTTATGGTWSVFYSADRASPFGVPNDGGSVTLTVSQSDAAGNPQTISRPIQIDTSAPLVPSIVAMSNDYGTVGDWTTDRNTVTLFGTGEALARLSITRGGVEIANVQIDASGYWSAPVSLADVAFGSSATFVARVVDGAGNPGPTAQQAITKASIGVTAANTVNLATIAASQTLNIVGPSTNAQSGGGGVAYGDINNDGRRDFIVGTPRALGNNGTDVAAGEATAIFGQASYSGVTQITQSDLGAGGYSLRSNGTDNQFGTTVAFFGDVNGDGIGDWGAGASGISFNAVPGTGGVWITFGAQGTSFPFGTNLSAGRNVIPTTSIGGSNGIVVIGNSNDALGASVAGTGDLNGDGRADMAFGMSGFDRPGGADAGGVLILFGRSDNLYLPNSYTPDFTGRRIASPDNVTATDGFIIRGANTADNAGVSIANAGDVNGDGINDLIIGARGVDRGGNANAGAAYVVFGKADGTWGGMITDPTNANRRILDLGTLQDGDGFRILGSQAFFRFGRAVAGIGDINGDGFADVAIGTESNNAYVVFGSRPSPGTVSSGVRTLDVAVMTAAQGFRLDGVDTFGQTLGAAGDVNADGIADFMIGSPNGDTTNGVDTGLMTVVLGKKDGVWGQSDNGIHVLSMADLGSGDGFQILGRIPTDRLSSLYANNGNALLRAGDINSDGIDDIGMPITTGDLGGSNVGNVTFLYGASDYGRLSLSGNSAANTLLGGDFNDLLTGGGGADILMGFAGNDVLMVADTNFARVDGGAGNDMLRLSGAAGLNLDLSTLAAGAIQGIEQIDLVAGSLNNTLTITQQTLLDLSTTSDRLTVFGDSGDIVNATGFTTGTAQTVNGITYNTYTSGLAQLWVQQGVQVQGVLGG